VIVTVVLKIGSVGLHCDGCMHKIRSKLFKIKGAHLLLPLTCPILHARQVLDRFYYCVHGGRLILAQPCVRPTSRSIHAHPHQSFTVRDRLSVSTCAYMSAGRSIEFHHHHVAEHDSVTSQQ
jgi:hypothetical protein